MGIERPILFSSPMVRAILEDRKTQTRRVVNFSRAKCASDCSGPVPEKACIDSGGTIFGPGPYLHVPCAEGAAQRVRCPYGYPEDGATLWVRETWMELPTETVYRADAIRDDSDERRGWWIGDRFIDEGVLAWRPPIFMPRALSRISLRVTGVRVERLQEIGEEDALAEGVMFADGEQESNVRKWGAEQTARMKFADLWDGINGKRAPWSSNPWVWCIAFERVSVESAGQVQGVR